MYRRRGARRRQPTPPEKVNIPRHFWDAFALVKDHLGQTQATDLIGSIIGGVSQEPPVSCQVIPINELQNESSRKLCARFGIAHESDCDDIDTTGIFEWPVSPDSIISTVETEYKALDCEASCRPAIDFVLYPVIVLLAGRTKGSGHARHSTPTIYRNLKISYEVKVQKLEVPTPLVDVDKALVLPTYYSGVVDFCVGIKPRPHTYFSVLTVVEAKRDGFIREAASQALVYMACIFQERVAKGVYCY
ncbi:hypothetical protein EV426DRAFT_712691 [Tirmania nivea]|nr:hypothetical protein EV426DRAFT_712691 [Tirmania nivea]